MKKIVINLLILMLLTVSGFAQTNWNTYPGNPVIVPGLTGEWDDHWLFQGGVLFQDATYHMWYSSWDGLNTRIGYATSPDAITWTKYADNPVLDIGLSGSWEKSVTGATVVYNESVYHMWYSGTDSFGVTRLGYATSPDRIVWTKYANNPVMDVGPSGAWDAGLLWGDVIFTDSLYQLWYVGWDSVNVRIGYATSPDAITWTKYADNPVLDIGLSGSWEAGGVSSPSIIYDDGTYHLWYGGGEALSPGAPFFTLNPLPGYATSTDGINWTKYAGNPLSDHEWDVGGGYVYYDGSTYHMWFSFCEWDGEKCQFRIHYSTSVPLSGGHQPFTRITQGDFVNNGGNSWSSNWIDYDTDGDLDLFVVNMEENNFLYRNNGDETFTKITTDVIVNESSRSRGVSWGDYDNDGSPDLYVSSWGGTNFLYHNNGDGTFTKVTSGIIANESTSSQGSAWADYDNDGYIDLFVVNRDGDNNILYHNSGDGTFTKITSGNLVNDGGDSYACDWADYDNDGDVDLFVANGGWGSAAEDNFLYRNNGDGTFTKITSSVVVTDGGRSFGGSWGDYDNDGDVDLFVTSFNPDTDHFYQNNGDGTFTEVTTGSIVEGTTSESRWVDYDNDGDLDLFTMKEYDNPVIFQNNGDGTFIKIATGHFLHDSKAFRGNRGFSWGDFDNDGDVDLFAAHVDGFDNTFFSNDGNANSWINIKFVGTLSNIMAIGTKVRVKANIKGSPVWQLREISGQSGGGVGGSQNSFNAEFGLGDASVIDSLIIEWPSGTIENFTNVNVNQFITATENGGITGINEKSYNFPNQFELSQNYPNPFNPVTSIRYSLPEASEVSLSIYNLKGELAAVLVKRYLPAGNHTVTWDGSNFASGIYFYRLQAGDFVQTRKMVLLK